MINNTAQALDDNLSLVLENRFPQFPEQCPPPFKGPCASSTRNLKKQALGKVDKEEVLTGKIQWGALADTYFMGTIVPLEDQQTASLKVSKPGPELLKIDLCIPPLDPGP